MLKDKNEKKNNLKKQWKKYESARVNLQTPQPWKS